MVINREELVEIPAWLNTELFQNCFTKVQSSENVFIKILSVQPAVGPGENFLSEIYRVKIEVIDVAQLLVKDFIVKIIPKNDNPDMETTLKELAIFSKETLMYSKMIPKFEDEYKKIGENVQFGPKLYKMLTNEVEALVFEDLNARNYFVGDRLKGLDIDHCELFYTKLAKFHAASAVYFEKNGTYDTKLFFSSFSENFVPFHQEWAKSIYPYFMNMIRSSAVLNHLADKIVSIL